MKDEAETGYAGVRDAQGSVEGVACPDSPLQARAAFLKNWSWESVVSHNRGVCERGKAQHGENPAGFDATATRWTTLHTQVITLGDTPKIKPAPQGQNVHNRRWSSPSERNRWTALPTHPAPQGLNVIETSEPAEISKLTHVAKYEN